jgi:hypothetical protein
MAMPRLTVLVLLVCISVLTLISCDSRSQSASSSSGSSNSGAAGGDDDEKKDPLAIAREVDKLATDDLGKSKIDAKQWLADEKHGTFDAQKSEILQFTNDVLAAGAAGVWVSEPEEYEGKQIIDHIYIQLPADAAARKKIIEIYNKRNEGEQDPEKDVGQKYLVHDWG